MNYLNVAYLVLGAFVCLGGLAAGLGYLISNFRDGRNKKSIDTLNQESTLLNYLKDQNAGYEQALIEMRKDMSAQDVQIAQLKTTIAERDKQLSEFKALINGTDPATKKFQEFMVASATTTNEILNRLTDKVDELETSHGEIKDTLAAKSQPSEVHIEGTMKTTSP